MKYRTSLGLAILVTLATVAYPRAQAASIDDFFRTFTDGFGCSKSRWSSTSWR